MVLADLVGAGDDLLERDPPELAVVVGKVGRHVERERNPPPLEQGVGIFEIVAIAVVEGEADEAPLVLLLEPPHRLVDRHHVEAGLLHLVEHGVEEIGGDFEDAVRRERLGRVLRGAYLVQREDEPHAFGIGGEQAVRAGMVKARHRRLHHGGFHLGQGRSPFALSTINPALPWS